jgi:hypothetical protein
MKHTLSHGLAAAKRVEIADPASVAASPEFPPDDAEIAAIGTCSWANRASVSATRTEKRIAWEYMVRSGKSDARKCNIIKVQRIGWLLEKMVGRPGDKKAFYKDSSEWNKFAELETKVESQEQEAEDDGEKRKWWRET